LLVLGGGVFLEKKTLREWLWGEDDDPDIAL